MGSMGYLPIGYVISYSTDKLVVNLGNIILKKSVFRIKIEGMKLKTMALAFVMPGIFWIQACRSDDHHETGKEIIVKHEWKLQSVKLNNMDITSLVVKDCFLDNSYVFRSNGRYDIKNNARKCTASEPDIIQDLMWSLSGDEKTITLDGTAFKVIQLSHTQAVLEGDLIGQATVNTYVPIR